MKEYVLDANAILAFLQGENRENAQKVRRFVQAARDNETDLFVSAINLGEVFYTLRKSNNEATATQMVSTLRGVASVIEAKLETAIKAAELKYRYKLGYADSFAALLAIERKATLVSADPDFEKLGNAIKWMKLQPHSSKG